MKKTISKLGICAAALFMAIAPNARAEMSEGAKKTGIACAYVGGIGVAAGHVFETGAVKTGLIACGAAAAAMGSYQYLVIPTEAAETPKETDLQPEQPSAEE